MRIWAIQDFLTKVCVCVCVRGGGTPPWMLPYSAPLSRLHLTGCCWLSPPLSWGILSVVFPQHSLGKCMIFIILYTLISQSRLWTTWTQRHALVAFPAPVVRSDTLPVSVRWLNSPTDTLLGQAACRRGLALEAGLPGLTTGLHHFFKKTIILAQF